MYKNLIQKNDSWQLLNEQGQNLPTGLQSITVTVRVVAGQLIYNLSDTIQQGFDTSQLVIGIAISRPEPDLTTLTGRAVVAADVFNASFLDFKVNSRSILDNIPLRQIVEIQDNNEKGFYPLPWCKSGNINWQNSKVKIAPTASPLNDTAFQFTFFAMQ